MTTFMTIVNEKEHDSNIEVITFKKDEIISNTIIKETLNTLYKNARKTRNLPHIVPKYYIIKKNAKGDVQMSITADTDFIQQHSEKPDTNNWASYNPTSTLAKLSVSRTIHNKDTDRINAIRNELIEELNIKAKKFKRYVIESSIKINIMIILRFEKI